MLFHFNDEVSTGVALDSGPHGLSASTDQTSNGTPTSYLSTGTGKSPSHFNWETSYYFDGSNDFLNILYPESLVLDGDWTIDFWVKFDDITAASGRQYLISRELYNDQNDVGGTGNDTYPYLDLWYDHNDANQWHFNTHGEYDDANPYHAETSKSMSNDTWYHIAITHDNNAGETRFFINGELMTMSESIQVYDFDWGATNQSQPATIRIGDGSEGNADRGKFKGYIDEFRIFKGETKWTADFTSTFGSNPPCRYKDEDGEDECL